MKKKIRKKNENKQKRKKRKNNFKKWQKSVTVTRYTSDVPFYS